MTGESMEKPGAYAVAACVPLAAVWKPGYPRRNSPGSSSFSTLVRICTNR